MRRFDAGILCTAALFVGTGCTGSPPPMDVVYPDISHDVIHDTIGNDARPDATVDDVFDASSDAEPDADDAVDVAPDVPVDAPVADALFAHRFGGTGDDSATGVGVDTNGNVYVSGDAIGPIDLGGGTTSAAPLVQQIFVASYTSAGAHRWSLQLTRTSSEGFARLSRLAVSPDGDVIVSGLFSGTFTYPGGTVSSASASSPAFFVMRLTSTGTVIWSRALGNTICTDCEAPVAFDGADSVLIAAPLDEAFMLDTTTLTPVASRTTAFAARLNAADGMLRWTRVVSAAGPMQLTAIHGSTGGDVYVAGHFFDDIDFGSGPITGSPDFYRIVYARLAGNDGALAWSNTLGATRGSSFANDIVATSTGDVVLTGSLGPMATLGGAALGNAMSVSFAARGASADGTLAWTRVSQPNATLRSVAIGGTHVAIGGDTIGNTTFGTTAVSSFGGIDALVVVLDVGSGAVQFAQAFGGPGNDRGWAIATNGDGTTHTLAGSMSGSVLTNSGRLTSAGGTDALLFSLRP